MTRIFSLRLNLDSMTAELIHWETDEERGQWIIGFQAGASGALARESWSEPKRAGYAFGKSTRLETEERISKQQAGGKHSANARRNKYGTTMVLQSNLEDTSKVLQSNLEDTLNQSNNPIIQLSNDPVNERTSTRAGTETNAFDEGPKEPIGTEEEWRYERMQDWAKTLVAEGAKVGPNNWTTWKRIVTEYGIPKTIGTIKSVSPDDRWPDKTEMAIKASGSQVSIGDAVKYKTRKINV